MADPRDPTEASPPDGPPSGPAPADDLFERLGRLGIPYRRHQHPPLFTVEDSKALRGTLPGGRCKSLFLRDREGAMWLVVCLENRPIDLKALDALLGGARLSFASPDRLMRALGVVPGVVPGAVTPFASINDRERAVAVILDAEMLRHDPLNYPPLRNDMTIAVAPDDLLRFLEDSGHRIEIVDLDPAAPAPAPG